MTITVRLEPSNRTFSASSDESVLQAAQRQGIVLPYSCENGTCGSCKARVVSGVADLLSYDGAALSAAEQEQGMTLLCRAIPKSDLIIEVSEVALADSMPPRILPARVARIEPLAADAMGVWLTLPTSEKFRFSAGQHLEILLRDGSRRCYSLANSPDEGGDLELHVRRVPRGKFSEFVFGSMKLRDLVRIRGPLGTFSADLNSTRPAILLAGGTGFAPIKSIFESAIKRGTNRALHLYWGARTQKHVYFQALVHSWTEMYGQFRYIPVLSQPVPDECWNGRVGLVHEAVMEDFQDLGGHSVYACGPPAMVTAARAEFAKRGLPPAHFHADIFTPARDSEEPQIVVEK